MCVCGCEIMTKFKMKVEKEQRKNWLSQSLTQDIIIILFWKRHPRVKRMLSEWMRIKRTKKGKHHHIPLCMPYTISSNLFGSFSFYQVKWMVMMKNKKERVKEEKRSRRITMIILIIIMITYLVFVKDWHYY